MLRSSFRSTQRDLLRRTFRFDEHVSNATLTSIFFLLEFPTFSSLQGATVGARTGIIVAVVVCVIALVTVIALYLARKFARRRSRVQVSSKRDDHGPAVIKRDSFTMVRTPRHSMEDIVDADIAERIGDLAVCPSRLFIEKEVGEGQYNNGILFNNQ